jgi:hypothetical protein
MPKKKRTLLSCDWKKTGSPVRMETHTENKSKLYKYRGIREIAFFDEVSKGYFLVGCNPSVKGGV